MNTPSSVSSKLMPDANKIGKAMIPKNGTVCCYAPADNASKETSLAVSNPKPNKNPKGKTCQL